ncbi:hypothetical protein LXL04_023159 [Taraxacum kok-saghyz]
MLNGDTRYPLGYPRPRWLLINGYPSGIGSGMGAVFVFGDGAGITKTRPRPAPLPSLVASTTWGEMFRWQELDHHHANTVRDVFDWVYNLVINTRKKEVVDAVVCTLKWYIWKFRNDVLFSKKMKRSKIVDAIKDYSFLWVTNRNKKLKMSYCNWLPNPLISLYILFFL